ncbi:MAG: endolytic transglycosylase MltG [Candidatus Kerfeldbacteria bacterium CG08_land_8_20_14_0_20_42_7]|uniref:Endolytic murein transglycosylase n=1 Tax=Candidatus Kerfeldbacteria bacterium CG08_land_8_20_14_0_20_42_7 TaxID=2014245 RepID=A0A2H0YSK0_9BACT|nr:MAG: endolytic transglycosylase MltG [Candidatus Kerfeldbacteria bacterium CG08_land_8_20_14_0_20_42_7]
MSKSVLTKTILWSLVAILIFGFIAVFWVFSSLSQEITRSSQVRFSIEQGWGVQRIAQELQNNGIITSKTFFVFASKLDGSGSSLKAGDYIIPASVSPNALVKLFASGYASDEITVRIKEEETITEIANDIEDQTDISADNFLEAATVTDSRELFPDVTFPVLSDKPTTQGLEGYIYPDTYSIFSYAKASDVIFKALTNLESKLTQEDRAAIASQGKTIFQILTLASIVEREEPSQDERSTVAGVFWNRLAIGMALQSDATINYILDTLGTERNAQPRTEQLKIESLYNTYLNAGLPPGPISNPTIKSIRATIYYTESDYYYFLHPQDGTHTTIYSKTLDEHNANKAKYLD